MIHRSRALLVATVVVVGSLIATGCNHWRHKSPDEHAAYLVEKATKKLALNATQVAKLNILRDQLLEVAKEHKQTHAQMHADALSLLSQPTFDRQRVIGMVDERTKMVNAKAPAIVNAFGDFYDSLDASQQSTLKEFVEDRMEHFGGRMH
ncbi:MAG: Spy/CpxP family protein refolding chaperone [Gammaproteobacteria bacterium]|nr:Spy/CpxP family protein refolding chaperone [Gammaproteobacteria bacterium]